MAGSVNRVAAFLPDEGMKQKGHWQLATPKREYVQVTFPSDSKFVLCVTSGYIFNLKALREK